MPIKQLFINGEINLVPDISTSSLAPARCQDVKEDEITWDDAETYVNDFKALLKTDTNHGDFLSFSLSQSNIQKLFDQNSNLNAIKIYLGYNTVDKTIRAFAVAGTLNGNNECDDWKLEENIDSEAKRTKIANTRPCPHQCGKRNFLNKPLP